MAPPRRPLPKPLLPALLKCGLEFEAELSNLSLCRRLAAVWNYGFSRSSQLTDSKD